MFRSFVMRTLILAAALGALAIPAVPAAAQSRSDYREYQRDVRQAQRECRRDLRRADSRREYRRELRDCRRDLREARRDFRDDRRDFRRDWRRGGPPYGNAWGYRDRRGYYMQPGRYWDGYRWRYRY
jgi:septal ring factor EnvC (AmiA/AmiB activator)